MRKIWLSIREKFGLPSGKAIIHIIIVEIIINVIWDQVSKPFTIPLVREIGFLVIIIAGIFAVAWYLPKLSPVLGGKSKDKDLTTSSKHVDSQSEKGLTQEQVAERMAFIKQLQGVAEKLVKNSQGANSLSILSILSNISKETPVKEYINKDGLASQALNLLKTRLDNLFAEASKYRSQAKQLSTNITDNDISSMCNITRDLILEYRILVNEVKNLLDNLEKKDVIPIWNSTPWSIHIHRDLADDYDELMRLVADLEMITPEDAKSLLPKDNQFTKFPRVSLWG